MPDYHGTVRTDVAPLVPKSGTLLDVGGGTGATARYLKDIGRADKIGVMDAVIAADADSGVDFASNVDLADFDRVEGFLSKQGPFDTILMLDVLEHLSDPWRTVDVFARYLSSGGSIVASVPNIRHISASGPLLFKGRWDYAEAGILDRTHIRFFVRDTAIKLFDRPGLEVEKVANSPISARRHKLANLLTLGALRSFFTLQYFIVAKRVD